MDSSYRYRNWYSRQNYDRIQILVPRGSRDRIKQAAEAEGKSLNAYVLERLPKQLLEQRQYIGKRGTKNEDSGMDSRTD